MKLRLILISFFLISCSERAVEEITFREVLKHDLIKLCGEDTECKDIVRRDIQKCMEEANWVEYLDSQDDEVIVQEFLEKFYGCLRYDDGRPLFVLKAEQDL